MLQEGRAFFAAKEERLSNTGFDDRPKFSGSKGRQQERSIY